MATTKYNEIRNILDEIFPKDIAKIIHEYSNNISFRKEWTKKTYGYVINEFRWFVEEINSRREIIENAIFINEFFAIDKNERYTHTNQRYEMLNIRNVSLDCQMNFRDFLLMDSLKSEIKRNYERRLYGLKWKPVITKKNKREINIYDRTRTYSFYKIINNGWGKNVLEYVLN